MPLDPLSFQILFTDASQLKAQSIVQENVDDKLIAPIIWDVQNVEIQTLLGTPLYADLQTKILNNTLNTDEKNLINIYITPVLKWALLRELTTSTVYQLTNKGILQMFADQEKPPSANDIYAVRMYASNRFDWFSARFIDYMGQFFYKFPKYLSIINYSDIPPLTRAYKSPFASGNGFDSAYALGFGIGLPYGDRLVNF